MTRAWQERPISTFFATGCGIGMIPFAPGTWGSVEGIAVFYGCCFALAPLEELTTSYVFVPGLFALAALLTAFGIFVSRRVEDLTNKDPGPVVVDEVVGQFIALAVPTSLRLPSTQPLWIFVLASFLLFRLFDIWKPGPIRKLQDLPGGWGIMLDDVAAGVLAGMITYGIGRLL